MIKKDWIYFSYNPNDDSLECIDGGGYESRNKSLRSMTEDAIEIIKQKGKMEHTISWAINSDDYPKEKYNYKVDKVFYQSDTLAKINTIYPDFANDMWPETGMSSYDETCNLVLEKSDRSNIIDERLFWCGNVNTHSNRKVLVNISRWNKNTMNIIYNDWLRGAPTGSALTGTNFVSLPDHTKYGKLIDIEGVGFSARTKVLAFTNRLLFVNKRPYWDWAMATMIQEQYNNPSYPFVIEVERNLSNLVPLLNDWNSNNNEACEIALRCQNFAKTHFTRKNAVDHIVTLLEDIEKNKQL